MSAGRGRECMLRTTEGIYIQAPDVTVRTPLAVNQYRTGEKGKGRKIQPQEEEHPSNPSTSSASHHLWENLSEQSMRNCSFKNEIKYESY